MCKQIMKQLKYILITSFSLSSFLFAQFPLEINNRWDFAAGEWWNGQTIGKSDTISFRITSDTVMPNGNRYYKIFPDNWFNNFLRADSIGIYCYDTVNNKEWLFYKYALEPAYQKYPNAEHLNISYLKDTADTTWYLKIYKWTDYKLLLFGDSTKIYSFYYDTGLDNSHFINISPQYGFIGIEQGNYSSNFSLNLIGCELSGKSYGTLTSVKEEKLSLEKYTLYQNYPNPFNPSTTIKYQIPKSGLVQLKIYDILGREVATLVNEEKPSGNYEVTFDGSKLASGVYYYQLNAGDFISSKKMIILK
ncbi:MAG: T9SS type A sorting domain-containing protein [Bacteroidetes bacterium]|nr:T9SS type A sorting domain-containing protein [Bacteroidota bacterium]